MFEPIHDGCNLMSGLLHSINRDFINTAESFDELKE